MRHGLLSFSFKVAPPRRAGVERLLASWAPDGAQPDQMNLGALPGLHFASVTLFDRPFLDPLILLECNFDGGDEDAFIDGLVRRCAPALRDLAAACGEEPPATAQGLGALLHSRVHRPLAAHIGTVGLTREAIVEGAALVARVRDHLAGPSGEALRREQPARIVAQLSATFGDAARPLVARPRRTLGEFAADVAPLGLLGLAALAVVVVVAWPIYAAFAHDRPMLLLIPALGLLAALALAGWFRSVERAEPTRALPWPADASRFQAAEDLRLAGGRMRVQNHLSSLAPLKTGVVRKATLRLFMGLLSILARSLYRYGSLGPIPSIHFAHWSVVDEGASLVFFSNYGGSWGSYLDDFIEKAARGLTLVWGHCAGFPPSRFVVGGGAREGSKFKAYARDSQTTEAVWFNAYPTLSAQRINNERAILEGLARPPHDPAAWLRRL